MDNEIPDAGQAAAEMIRSSWHAEWRRADEAGNEEFDLVELTDGRWMFQGFLDLPVEDGKALWVRYIIVCDADWRTRQVRIGTARNPQELSEFPQGGPLLSLSADGTGNWRVDDAERLDLRGCLDVDLGCTPSTNTLPIRRLRLDVGQSAEVTAAWVRFPDLSVEPLHQRYTRLATDRYRYESLDSDFTADLTVDEQGVVVDYPGGWRRTAL